MLSRLNSYTLTKGDNNVQISNGNYRLPELFFQFLLDPFLFRKEARILTLVKVPETFPYKKKIDLHL